MGAYPHTVYDMTDKQRLRPDITTLELKNGMLYIPYGTTLECLSRDCLHSWPARFGLEIGIRAAPRCPKCRGRKIALNGLVLSDMIDQARHSVNLADHLTVQEVANENARLKALHPTPSPIRAEPKEDVTMSIKKTAKEAAEKAAVIEEKAQDADADRADLEEKEKEAQTIAQGLADGTIQADDLFGMASLDTPAPTVPIMTPDSVKALVSTPSRTIKETQTTSPAPVQAPGPMPPTNAKGAHADAGKPVPDAIYNICSGTLASLELRFLEMVAKYEKMPDQCRSDLVEEWKVTLDWLRDYLEEHKYILVLLLLTRHLEWMLYAFQVRATHEEANKTAASAEGDPVAKAPTVQEQKTLEQMQTPTQTPDKNEARRGKPKASRKNPGV
jgi:hypothetical protein